MASLVVPVTEVTLVVIDMRLLSSATAGFVRRSPVLAAAGALLFLLLASAAQAAWADIKAGLDQKTTREQVGVPLIQNKARQAAIETWTYDDGGYILFENGRVRYWQAPRPKKIEGGAKSTASPHQLVTGQ